jgi:TPR repeat protein
MSSLGDAYQTGALCDYAESMRWYHLAAERGDPMSMCKLGGFYRDGRGVEKNFTKMVEWYKMAAEKGFDMGKGLFAAVYALGHGVQQDYVQAYAWFKRASTLPVEDELKSLTEKMTPDQIAEGERLANEWNPRWDPSVTLTHA